MEFKNYSFKDLLSHIVDNRGKTCPVENIGIPLIATNCIKDDSLYAEYERIRFVSDDTYKTWFRGHPEPEDIIFVCKGSPGRVAWVQNPVPYCIAQDMVAIRANKSLIDSKFLFALLRNPSTQKSILNMHVGTMIPHFKKGDFSNLYFDIPQDLAYQKWAGELYFSFSEKIELNKQTNQTLEQMAQALFKSWFVDFDPVFDNAFDAGLSVDDFPDELQQRAMIRQQHRSDAMRQDAEVMMPQTPLSNAVLQPQNQQATQTESERIRGLFPSEFEQCDDPSIGINGWIPKGWAIVTLADITTELRRGISPKYLEDGGTQVINQKCIRNHEINFNLGRRHDSEIKKINGRELLLGDVLVNSTGVGTLGRMAQVNYLPEPTVVDSHVTVVRPDITQCPAHTFGQVMLASESRVEALGEGSTGQTELSRKILSEQKSILPPFSITSHIEGTFKSFSEKKIINSLEIIALSKIRDTLLPKLISGELQLSEAVQSIETK